MIVAVLAIVVDRRASRCGAPRIQRDKEEELISRGFQYAEAIRVFQQRFGRLPNRLEELIKVKPRSIRQLWKDPMTDSGAWGVIVELPGRGMIALDSRTGQPLAPVDLDGDGEPDPPPPPVEPPPDGGHRGGRPDPRRPEPGPRRGLHKLFDKEDYGDWEFTVEVLQTAIAQTGALGAAAARQRADHRPPVPLPAPRHSRAGGRAGGQPGRQPPGSRQRPGPQPQPPPSDDTGDPKDG